MEPGKELEKRFIAVTPTVLEILFENFVPLLQDLTAALDNRGCDDDEVDSNEGEGCAEREKIVKGCDPYQEYCNELCFDETITYLFLDFEVICGCIHKKHIHNSHFFRARSVVGRHVGLGRRSIQPDSTVEPPAKILRKSRSLRNMAHELVMGDMLLENDVESDPTSAELLRSNVEPMESHDDTAREDREDGREDETGAPLGNGPEIQEFKVLDHRQRMLFATSFKLYFGVSDEMLGSLEDLCRVMAPDAAIDSHVAVLAYWKLARVLEKPGELTALDFRGCHDLANSMKLLWYAIEPSLITLKVHLLSPQAMVDKLGDEVELIENDCLDRLYCKVTQQGRKARCDTAAGDVDLENNCSRLCQSDRIYSSAYNWKKRMDTIQHCVCMENDDGESLDTGSSFGFDS
ncbi:unnamed protein product [Heligmosomoides polygyrus]|uniref:Uncharacterized protein n=1 Tax=Heligmosomoides polygyrus TaxID=6339 RepID=A0A183GH38_HELPZ|nr:unnamed protein product [Heligmosomoides polygyrus]